MLEQRKVLTHLVSLLTTRFIGDGSLLTGITATGSGVEIRSSDTIVGSAATINFGDNINVSSQSPLVSLQLLVVLVLVINCDGSNAAQVGTGVTQLKFVGTGVSMQSPLLYLVYPQSSSPVMVLLILMIISKLELILVVETLDHHTVMFLLMVVLMDYQWSSPPDEILF